MPDNSLSSILLVKILSINVLECSDIRVGNVIFGMKPYDNPTPKSYIL